jgi:hypothetical protein
MLSSCLFVSHVCLQRLCSRVCKARFVLLSFSVLALFTPHPSPHSSHSHYIFPLLFFFVSFTLCFSLTIRRQQSMSKQPLPPHVYSIADHAFSHMCMDGKNQSVIIRCVFGYCADFSVCLCVHVFHCLIKIRFLCFVPSSLRLRCDFSELVCSCACLDFVLALFHITPFIPLSDLSQR